MGVGSLMRLQATRWRGRPRPRGFGRARLVARSPQVRRAQGGSPGGSDYRPPAGCEVPTQVRWERGEWALASTPAGARPQPR